MDNYSEVKLNVPLARYTTYKVGGCAKIYFKPKNIPELVKFIQELPVEEEILWLGLGSNLLIRDGGFDGAVIHMHNVLQELTIIEQTANAIIVKVGAGVSCGKLAKFCIQHNLEDGIWFAGIPGSVGGALKMNAGAFGGTTWEHVQAIEVINRQGEITNKLPHNYQIAYRSVEPLGANSNNILEWFVSAKLIFRLNPTDVDIDGKLQQQKLQIKLQQLMLTRKAAQPIGTLNCGSVFKNPENNWAGKLIEQANLKGVKIGDAVVAAKHANFIINLGKATAKDIESLIKFIQAEVLAKYNIYLEPEVKIVGKY